MRRTRDPGSAPSPLRLTLLLCLVGVALLAASTCGSAKAASSPQTLTFYSVATQQQFLDMSDDRARGKGNTPFGNFKDTATPTKESGAGPFAGDISLFSFALYTSADLNQSVGTGVFTCQYTFHQNAFCDVTYKLSGGTLLCAGAFNFNAKSFKLVVKGGTGKYRGVTGDIAALPAVHHAQRLDLVLNQ
jgi:hypothetical protein